MHTLAAAIEGQGDHVMNERHFAYKLRQRPDRGLRDRLSAARRATLVRQRRFAVPPALAADGHFFPASFRDLRSSQTLAAIAFLLCTFYSTSWIADQRMEESGNIDSAILSGGLPIDAFTGERFAAWLDDESPAE
jgi:hypothetical protein